MKIINWLNKGSGGEWFESFINNKDLLIIFIIAAIISGLIIFGCYLI